MIIKQDDIQTLKVDLKKKENESEEYFKLGIGIPLTDRKVFMLFFLSWVFLDIPRPWTFFYPRFPGHISDVRNDIVAQALNVGCTHLLMMDTDQTFPPDIIHRLLSHDKDVVAGRVHRRYPPFDPIMYRGELHKYKHVSDEDIFSKKLIEVDATGCGCVLWKTKVFIDIPRPWFEFTPADPHTGNGSVGEDIGFCWKLKQAGYNIFVDTSLEIEHLALMAINKGTYLIFKKLADMNNVEME